MTLFLWVSTARERSFTKTPALSNIGSMSPARLSLSTVASPHCRLLFHLAAGILAENQRRLSGQPRTKRLSSPPGAGSQATVLLPVEGEIFFLTFPFIEPRSERFVQSGGYHRERAARTLAGVLSSLARQRHQANHGTPYTGTQDRGHYANTLEKRRRLRRRETKIASRLCVSVNRPSISHALILVAANQFLRRSGSRVSILIACRHVRLSH